MIQLCINKEALKDLINIKIANLLHMTSSRNQNTIRSAKLASNISTPINFMQSPASLIQEKA